MTKKNAYPNIDMHQTGIKLKSMIEVAGYTPKMIQDYLHLSCVQPIYRWYKGLILPSVDHLFMLSELLNVHIEDLLVSKDTLSTIYNEEHLFFQISPKHLYHYYKTILLSHHPLD